MLQRDGYEIVPSVLSLEEIDKLLSLIPDLESQAGTRNLLNEDWCVRLAADRRVTYLVEGAIGPTARPIRGILFDKNPSANWNLGWHQDKKIAVKERVDTPGYFAWSEKEGVVHCQAPSKLLGACLAVRIHLDDCGWDNGPLRVLPGSHLYGVKDKPDPEWIDGAFDCLVKAGGVVLMKPLLFHASAKAEVPQHRRVIHIEYCSASLPNGLQWAFG